MPRIALIVNPLATRVTPARTAQVERALSAAAPVTRFETAGPGHAIELAREAAATHDAVVVYAGDGGANEVVNGLAGTTVPVGFLPGGGTSVLARALGMSRDAATAAEQVASAIEAGRSRTISLGRVNDRRFAFSAGIGFDAAAVRRVDQLGRRDDGRRPGDMAFAREVVRLLVQRRGRFEPVLDVQGLGRAAFAFVANADPYTYAGPLALHVAPEARFDLGLDVVAPRSVSPARVPRYLTFALLGRGQERADDVLYGHDLDTFEIVCDAPQPLQVDGEDLGDVGRASFVSERNALRVLA